MKSILIIEVEHKGHHFVSYLKNIINKLQKKKIKCYLITTTEALKSVEYDFFKKSIKKNIKIFTINKKFKIIKNNKFSILIFQIIIYFKIKFLIKKLIEKKFCFDLIYINTLDHFEKIFCVFGPFVKTIPTVCLLMNIKFHFNEIIHKKNSHLTWIYEFLFKRLVEFKNIKKIIILDELFKNYLKLKNIDCKKKISLIPEMGEIKKIYNKTFIKNIIGIPKKHKVMLIYGVINNSKGIKESIFSLLLENQVNNLTILIVGKQDPSIKNFMNTSIIVNLLKNKKIIVIDKFINEELERKIFTISDFGWAGYVYGSNGSSGFLVQACSAGLPIICNNKSLISYYVKKNNLGIIIDPFNYKKTNRALKKFIYMNNYKKYVNNCHIFAKTRTKKNFLDQLLLNFYD